MNNNLWDRLKPEVKKVLEEELAEYPSSMELLRNALKLTDHVGDLPYLTVAKIISYANLPSDTFRIHFFAELFSEK